MTIIADYDDKILRLHWIIAEQEPALKGVYINQQARAISPSELELYKSGDIYDVYITARDNNLRQQSTYDIDIVWRTW